MSQHDITGICANRRKFTRMSTRPRTSELAVHYSSATVLLLGVMMIRTADGGDRQITIPQGGGYKRHIMNEKSDKNKNRRDVSCRPVPILNPTPPPPFSNLSPGRVIASCEWGSRESRTTRIDHAEVLPGSWKAGVPKGLVADSNGALLFAVAGLGHEVHSLVVQTLCGEQQREPVSE